MWKNLKRWIANHSYNYYLISISLLQLKRQLVEDQAQFLPQFQEQTHSAWEVVKETAEDLQARSKKRKKKKQNQKTTQTNTQTSNRKQHFSWQVLDLNFILSLSFTLNFNEQ